MKYLLWIALIAILYWTLRRQWNPLRSSPPVSRAPERMVSCAYCGINVPIGESVSGRDCHFCSIEHQQASELRTNERKR